MRRRGSKAAIGIIGFVLGVIVGLMVGDHQQRGRDKRRAVAAAQRAAEREKRKAAAAAWLDGIIDSTDESLHNGRVNRLTSPPRRTRRLRPAPPPPAPPAEPTDDDGEASE